MKSPLNREGKVCTNAMHKEVINVINVAKDFVKGRTLICINRFVKPNKATITFMSRGQKITNYSTLCGFVGGKLRFVSLHLLFDNKYHKNNKLPV